MSFRLVLLTLSLILIGAVSAGAQSNKPDEQRGEEGKKLHALFDREWEWQLREYPTFATYVGDPRYNDRLTDSSFEAIEMRKKHTRDLLAELQTFNRSRLSPDDQLNYDLYLRDVKESIEGQKFPEELFAITQMGGVHSEIAELAQIIPRFKLSDYENFLQRLEATPALVDQNIALLQKGAKEGVTPPRITLREVGKLIGHQVVDDPTKSPIYQILFEELPSTISELDSARLKSSFASAIRDKVVPAYRKFQKFYLDEYESKTRESIGMSRLPDGQSWYAYRVKVMTTTDKTPEEIHQIGLSEVKRIRAEMEAVKEKAGFKGTLSEFFTFLRTDPQFYFTEKEALLTAYRDIAKRIDPQLVELFGTLPRLPYGVVPVPEYSEKTQTTAYYNAGSPEGGRPGYFYANTYALKSRPKWEMEALTVHEAVPGHHLQIALAQELTNVPKFRRFGGYTAFVEGWGLYSESLGPELGLYKDPYSKFGQLTYEMWRAVRLVVDTGMHAKGWTRDRAIQFFKDNAGKTEHDILVEIDRYIVWPGQALAYKLGELKIKELRAWSTKELGDRFSIREFHDTVLGAGALPLSILETRVKEWVARTKGAAAKG